jgi:signal transduction histidine kinase
MSGIGSTFRRRWVEIAWGAFAAANVVVIFLVGQWETIPFHFVWVSLTVVYGIRLWSLRSTAAVLVAGTATTGIALLWAITHADNPPGLDELAEVPLMAAMFVAMVWHAERRQSALDEVRRLAESEHRLLESQREFVRDASHELRTPITVAAGHAELIRDATSDPQVRQDAEVVLDELGRLTRLSERLLLLAALEHPGVLSMSRVYVRPLLLGTARRWSPMASRRWLVDASAEGYVVADEERLKIALDALIENAVKFTGEGDRIAVTSGGDRDRLMIEIADSGAGIDPERIDRIFEPFARGSGDRARGAGGTGLGLAIVKAIAEAHGGSAEVISAPDEGATFRIWIPGLRRGSAAAATGDGGGGPQADRARATGAGPSSRLR